MGRLVWASVGSEAYLVLLDAGGEITTGPWPIGKDTSGQALLVRGDELLLAYTVSQGGSELEDRATSVRLARFDRSGRLLGKVRGLQAPVQDRSVQDPVLSVFGDDLALMWSEGTQIYYCAGCVLDNTLKVVVLDGADWSPKSQVVELGNAIHDAGLLRPQLGSDAERLLVVANMEWHTAADAASAVVRCTR